MKDEGLTHVTVSLMSQYAPHHRAHDFPELRHTVASRDYRALVDYALELGFDNLLVQAPESHRLYVPDFGRDKPFL